MEGLKIFLAVLLELILGAMVFYFIILIAYGLEHAIASRRESEESLLYLAAKGGEIFLLIADCLIGIFFVTRGIDNAWLATWGS